jgi:uncharacterized protein YndB with AHSA1/START domain
MSRPEGSDDRVLGSLRIESGEGVVRIADRLDAGIEDVWSALTDPLRLARWLGTVEGNFGFGGEYFQVAHASGSEGTVRIVEFESPTHLRYTQTPLEPDEPVITIEITLTSDDNGADLTLDARGMPSNQLFAYGAGWQIHVEDLAAHLAGLERCDAEKRWHELEPAYEELAANLA